MMHDPSFLPTLPPRHWVLAASAMAAPAALMIVLVHFWPDHDLVIRTGGAARAYIGADFVNTWIGARLALQGDVAALFDLSAYVAALRTHFVADLAVHNWSYPPHLLLFVWPLGLMPYLPALVAWSIVTLGLYLWAAWPEPGPGRGWIVAALLIAPAGIINFFGGQNGFLTAALLIGGWRLMARRPILAGVLFGILTIKPHLGVLLPFALMAIGAWRTIAAAGLTALGLVAVSALVWGAGAWSAYLGPGMALQEQILADMQGLFVQMMPTIYVSARLLGASHWLAMSGQGMVAVAVIAVTMVAVRRTNDPTLRLALVASGTICASPYALNYDLTALSGALILFLARSPGPDRRLLIVGALALAAPALVMPANSLGLPFMPLVMLMLFGLLTRECFRIPANHKGPGDAPQVPHA